MIHRKQHYTLNAEQYGITRVISLICIRPATAWPMSTDINLLSVHAVYSYGPGPASRWTARGMPMCFTAKAERTSYITQPTRTIPGLLRPVNGINTSIGANGLAVTIDTGNKIHVIYSNDTNAYLYHASFQL